jgi:ribulose-phosphate 3-epimerase
MTCHRESVRDRLAVGPPHIFPALLQCRFGRLVDEIAQAKQHGAIAVHWDVMDGHFVPTITYGPVVIQSLRPLSDLVFDAHLMIAEPKKLLDQFLAAGCDIITVHLETVRDPGTVLRAIRQAGAIAGLAIAPPTPVEQLEPWLDEVDLVLIMGVTPGAGGQAFDPTALPKLQWVRQHARPGTLIQVDGGINRTTVESVVRAGAQLLVVGSAYFAASDRPGEFAELSRLARSSRSTLE